MAGLVNTDDVVDGDDVRKSLDAMVDLVAQLQDNLATPSHILLDPLGWAELRKFKTGSAFNSSLLGADTPHATPMVLSLPLIGVPAVPDYSGVVVDQRAIVSAVGQVKVATSEDQYFGSDSVLLRATWRFGHVVVRPTRLGVFTVNGGGS